MIMCGYFWSINRENSNELRESEDGISFKETYYGFVLKFCFMISFFN